jgi:solute carrier family 10 (sodium/bile acid cotransporter), member 7
VKLGRLDPYLVALGATVAFASVWPAVGRGAELLDVAVGLAVAGLFFAYGARLSLQQVWQALLGFRPQVLVLVSTYVVFPLLGLFVVQICGAALEASTAQGIVFLSILPSTVQSSIAFTSIARGNVAAALCAASVSNLVGVGLTPWLALWLVPGGGDVELASAVSDIAVQILLPFVLGQVARPMLAEWLSRHKRATSLFDRGSILLLVYSAFSAGMVAGIWKRTSLTQLAWVLFLNGVLLAAILGFTFFSSRALGLERGDEIAVVFCGSKKSMASGLPMAHLLYTPELVSVIVVPLMLFHQLQLFVCAFLARRYAAKSPADAREMDPA